MNSILTNIGFLRFTIVDLLDIVMVAAVIYILFKWIKGSAAVNIFIAIISLLLLRLLVDALNMKMMSVILGTVIDVGTVALVVIFQPEIRSFLFNIGRKVFSSKGKSSIFKKLLNSKNNLFTNDEIDEIVQACFEMGEQKVGALIVIPGSASLNNIADTGDKIDATISKALIENIFFKNSPLHDGAMIMGQNRIAAARCTLPITERTDIPAYYGMRHKAAIGLSEKYDASLIVVSEQRGTVSFVSEGKIKNVKNTNTLKLLLSNDESKTGSEAGL
ncbi:MAG: diadenylate cyclase CdaA [Candidatus Cryptobacteroides sp.]